MAWAYKASSYANDGTGFGVSGTYTVSPGASLASGDRCIVTVVGTGPNGTSGTNIAPTFSVSDGGGSYHEDVTRAFYVSAFTCWLRISIFSRSMTSSGTPSISVVVTNTGTGTNNPFGGIQVAAFSGLDTTLSTAADATGSRDTIANSGGNPTVTASSSTTAANELVVSAYGDGGDGVTLTGESSPSTTAGKHDNDSSNYEALLQYKDSGSSGSTPTSTATSSGATWCMAQVVYKLASTTTTGTAAITLQTPSVAASGTNTDSGTSAITLQTPSVSGTGTVGATGTAAITLQTPSFAGSSSSTITGTVAITLQGLHVAGTASAPVTGTAPIVVQTPSVSASGTIGGGLPINYYHTAFPGTENPISEGGVWVSGSVINSNVRTLPHDAFGTQPNHVPPATFDDSICYLRGTWNADQKAQAIVVNTLTPGAFYQEFELLLRCTTTGSGFAGYECTIGNQNGGWYSGVTRINGDGSFTILSPSGPAVSLATGDVMSAEVIGSTITIYKNGSSVVSVTDTNITAGAPGFGFYESDNGATGDSTKFGYSDYTAWGDVESSSANFVLQRPSVLGGTITTGTGTLTLQTPSVAATGYQAGSGAMTLQRPSVAASGTLTVGGTAAIVLQTPSFAGVSAVAGPAAITLQTPSVAATGYMVPVGTSAITLHTPFVQASGVVIGVQPGPSGSAVTTAPPPTGTAVITPAGGP